MKFCAVAVALSLENAPTSKVVPLPGGRPASRPAPVDGDLVRSYLRDIGRVPLLTHEQEITFGRQVQELMALEELETDLESNLGSKPSQLQLAEAAGLDPAVLSGGCTTAAAPRSGWWPPTCAWW